MSAPEPGHLVVVGSSAGGIEALGILVSGLAPEFPAPVVLAQHLDPTRPSQLAGILERRSRLPVVSVTADTALAPGHVYVVPSNRHVVIRDGQVGLEEDHGDRPRPSIDLLLSTAARSYGEKLIAVILTGSGSDGAEGAVEVKETGGCVVIQNPRTAAHPSMPSALPPTAVDHIVDLEQIAPLLQDILNGTSIEKRIESVDRSALDEVLSLVTRHGNIDFHQYKSTTILRRISRRMAVNHTHTLEEYRDYLTSHPGETGELVKSFLIQVTEFFRDPEAFSFLEHDVAPKLIQTGRERGRVLRLWSAGCATGEEPYSLALLLAHSLGRELPEWSIKIFATDVDADAIAYARRGYYPPNVLRSLPPDYRTRYFEAVDHGYRVNKALRQMIIFGQQDLSRGVPFPRIDLITCRNLLIYFKADLQQSVLDLFAYSLQQTGGYLFLGKAETARPSRSVYEMVNKKWKIYRCVSGPLPMPVRPLNEGEPVVAAAPPSSLVAGGDGSSRPEVRSDETEIRRTNELLLRSLPVGLCVIDRTYRIISLNASARRLLGIREAATDQDFLHTVRGLPYADVRAAIDRAFRERSAAVLPQIELTSSVGEARFIAMQVIPLEAGAPSDSAMICIENVTDLVQTQRRLDAVQAEQSQLTQDLGSANQRLLEVNKDLQDANEELQAANEEMMLAQEELQATNEEFEATNEELQATNEELETNNEELQATNEELETTNEELQARTSELQELTHILSSERTRLSEIVEQAPFHILLLRGQALTIESMNPPLAALFEETRVTGRPFEEVCTDPDLEPVRLAARRCFKEGRPWHSDRIRVGTGEDERYLVFSVVPTHSSDGVTEGVVVYVEDVTERRQSEEAEKLGKIKMMLDHANQLAMALFDARTGVLLHASQQYLEVVSRIRNVDSGLALGRRWKDLWLGDKTTGAAFGRVVSEGKPARLHEVHIEAGGTSAVWDCNLIPIASEGGPVDYVVLTAVEVTRPVQAREALEQVDRLKDSFLSLASHELRTPLTPLTAYLELLTHLMGEDKRHPEWEHRVKEVIEKLRRQVTYLSRLTEDLADISRIRSGKFTLVPKPVDLKRIVDEAREQALAMERSADIRVQASGDGSLVAEADEMRMVQVVLNLLSNALKHATSSDHVDVSLRAVGKGGKRWGRVEVRDYGPGIPDAMRHDLFVRTLQPSAQEGRTARSGMGLGLFIAARIVEQHGGVIGADSKTPGTMIWFEIPLASMAATAPRNAATAEA